MLPPREYTENTQVTGGDEVLTGSFFKKTKEELDAGAAAKKKAAGMAGDSKSAKPFLIVLSERPRGGII